MMMQEYNTGKGHKEAVNALKRYFTLPLAKKSIRLLAEGTIQKNCMCTARYAEISSFEAR